MTIAINYLNDCRTEGQLESLKYEGDYTRQEIRVLDFSLSTPNSKTSKQ